MKEQPLVSILIPSFNRPIYIQEALESALEQTYSNLEVVICDDSSNDCVQEVITPYMERDSRIRYYRNSTRLRLGNKRKCFELAQGELINYLMDDDVFHREKLSRMVDYFEDENIKLVTSRRELIDCSGNILPGDDHSRELFVKTSFISGKDLVNRSLVDFLNVIGEPTAVLFRKRDLSEMFGNYKGEEFFSINDLASWLNLLSKGDAVYISDSLSYIRIHTEQEQRQFGLDVLREQYKLVVSARKSGYLSSENLYHRALNSYKEKVSPYIDYLDKEMRKLFLDDLLLIDFALSKSESYEEEEVAAAEEDQPFSLEPPDENVRYVGGGDFTKVGNEFLSYFIKFGQLQSCECVLEVGCGCGRMAVPLTKFLDTGSYWGFDIYAEGVKWCKENISSRHRNFQFKVVDIFNKYYRPEGKYQASEYVFPYQDNIFDFVTLTSVFTHLVPNDMENYLDQVSRVLKAGGRCLFTAFLLNSESREYIASKNSTIPFIAVHDHYSVVNPRIPEEAIAYDQVYMNKVFTKYGFSLSKSIQYGSWCGREEFVSYQDLIVLEKV